MEHASFDTPAVTLASQLCADTSLRAFAKSVLGRNSAYACELRWRRHAKPPCPLTPSARPSICRSTSGSRAIPQPFAPCLDVRAVLDVLRRPERFGPCASSRLLDSVSNTSSRRSLLSTGLLFSILGPLSTRLMHHSPLRCTRTSSVLHDQDHAEPCLSRHHLCVRRWRLV